MKKRVGQIDLNTGEVLNGYIAVLQPRRRNGFIGGWMAMAHNFGELMASLHGEELHRVTWALLTKLDLENWIRLSHAELAEELGMKRPNVSRAIARLVDLGVLLVGPKIGHSHTYRLNPNYGWKGSARRHREVLEERLRSRGLNVIQGGKNEGEPTTEEGEKLD